MSSLNGVKGSPCLSVNAIISGVLFFFSTLSTPISANDVLCDASQPSSSQLPILSQDCPIGNGVWSQTVPKTETSVYWIQCGILDEAMSLNTAKVLYTEISTDVWMKPEGEVQRCLIGPYRDVDVLKKELSKIKSIKGYKDAFIRQVAPSKPQKSPVASEPKKYPKATPKPPMKAMAKPIAQAIGSPTVKQTASVKKVESIQPLAQSVSPSLSVRRQTQLGDQRYAVPYLEGSQHQFYMEHDKAWNRMNYSAAIKVCGDLNMHLVTANEWQTLLNAKVMQKNQWPMQMPYWGDGQKGLFTNGKVSPLKSNTLLNVMCVGK
ncbi:SPOR domain-containing protein [Vibrio methylphosphonaticus]|uniref:SPOR domain-containing protein n=1 Tax=Vibrio methylphosphonaticus TaxID=2946866 RepID=UPI00202A530A|nr:SPOR domain-containing protein [Vibrio methylphosphonaticus]MCL9776573.1 SPOR domain-containing protein [Vibrio methylphosphonaticus]